MKYSEYRKIIDAQNIFRQFIALPPKKKRKFKIRKRLKV